MEAFEKLIKKYLKLQVVQGTVEGINGDRCTVALDDDSKTLFKVSLNAIRTNSDNKMICYPSVGSSVVVGVFEGEREAVVLAFSEVEKFYFKKKSTKLQYDDAGFIIERDGENLGKVMDDFMNTCQQIVVVQGNTINQENVQSQRNRLKKILNFT